MPKRDNTEQYPILEKTAPLSADETERLQRTMRINERVQESILELLIAAQTRLVDQEAAVWNEIAKKFGQTYQEIMQDGKMLRMDWATGIVELRSKGPAPEAEYAGTS